jgi:hypothetical protein
LVLDAQFRFPLRAVVLVGPDRWIPCNSKGEFSIVDTPSGMTLRVEADGYQSKLVQVESLESVALPEVLLEPLRKSAVFVEDDSGVPMPGVAVDWQAAVDPINAPRPDSISDWISSRVHVSGLSIATVTDSQGVSSLSLSMAAMVTVRDPKSSGFITVRVQPGAEVVVHLSDTPTRLQFVDDQTEAPAAGIEIEVWSSAEIASSACTYLTDKDGIIEVQTTAYPVLVRRPGGENFLEEMVSSSPGITRAERGYFSSYLAVEDDGDSELRQVRIRRSGSELLLLDAQSGRPIDARVWMRAVRNERCPENVTRASLCSASMPRSGSRDEDTTFTSKDGLVPVPYLILQQLNGQGPLRACDTIVLCASGYSPIRIPANSFPVRQVGLVHPVHLEPTQPRSLHVRYANGMPYRSTVWVYAPQGDVSLWRDNGRDDGEHGPFDWGGGDLQVGFGDDPFFDVKIPAGDLDRSTVIELVVPVKTGALEIRGIPIDYPASNLGAKLGLGAGAALYRPVSGGSGRCRFEDLPCGSYAVGPESWIGAVELKMLEGRLDDSDQEIVGTRRIVEEGKTTIVDWDPNWGSSVRIEGQIQAPRSTEGRLFLLPDYGSSILDRIETRIGTPRATISRRSRAIPMDRAGRYVIQVGDPVPRTIALCLSYDAGADWGTLLSFLVIETIRPGESLKLELGSIECVRTDSPPWGNLLIEYVMPASALRYPLDTYFNTRRTTWQCERPVLIQDIPLAVDVVRVGGVPIPVSLKPNEVVKIPWARAEVPSPPKAR